jgi:dihydroxy-acid dehydratase
MIEIDISARKLNVELSEKKLKDRIAKWVPPSPRVTEGFLTLYARLATRAGWGAGLDLRLK